MNSKTWVLIVVWALFLCGCKYSDKKENKITMLSFGAGFCMECKKMKDVINELNQKDISELKIECFNVTEKDGKAMADKYNIKMIPAQVFINQNGEEFYRHTGFLSEKEIISIVEKEDMN